MKYKFESENAVWNALSREDSQALQHIYKKYFHIWISWMTQRGGSRADGEDVFQEAVVILVEKSKDRTFTLTAQVNTLLMTICKRMWYRKIQKSHVTQEINDNFDFEDNTDIDILEEHLDKEKQYEMMNLALGKLGEPCASILRSFYILNKSMSDIASEHNYSNADNAKNQKYKCLNRLKRLFFNTHQDMENKNVITK